jgi:hypothetical protein
MEMKMSETLSVERIGRTPVTATELVHSPDDNGYYLSQADFQNRRGRVSAQIYPTRDKALAAWNSQTVEWDPWH